jgi:hypothetical protein
MGIVVHDVVSQIMTYVQTCDLNPNLAVMSFLKQKGGYAKILKDAVEQELETHRKNPRAVLLIDSVNKEIMENLSLLREQVQFFVKKSVSQIAVNVRKSSTSFEGAHNYSQSIMRHVNSEFKISDEQLPIEGYLDLLIVNNQVDQIIDYKTSKTIYAEYWDQLRLYAWLWNRSPKNLKKSDCIIKVISGSNTTEQMLVTQEEYPQIEAVIVKRIESAEAAITGEVVGRPSEEACRFCSVKTLCDDYWNLIESKSVMTRWSDLRIKIVDSLGGSTWKVKLLSDESMAMLVLGDRDDGTIHVGDEINLLNVYFTKEDEDSAVIRLSQNSEVFRFATIAKR